MRVSAQAFAVLHEHVANTAGRLAADPDAGPHRIVERAVRDPYVFAHDTDNVGLHTATTLERDAVIACLKLTALNHYMFAGVHVNAVGSAMYGHIPERDVLAVHGMHRPHIVALSKHILDQQIFAARKLHQCRVTNDVLSGNVCRAIRIACRSPRRWPRVHHRRAIRANDTPFNLRAGDNLSLANDRDVLCLLCGHKRAIAFDPAALPAHLRHWVVGNVGRTHQARTFLNPQRCVRTKHNRARQILARRHQNLPPSKQRAAVQSLLNRGCIFGLAITQRTEVSHIQVDARLCRGGRSLFLRTLLGCLCFHARR